jgi:hypothetical protein
MRCDDGELTVAWQHGGGEPFAAPPLHAGEIHHRGAGLDEQRADAMSCHERASLVDSRRVFRAGNGFDVRRHGFEARSGFPREEA